MTGYITSGSFRIAQDFTTDLALAADSLRNPAERRVLGALQPVCGSG